MARKGFLVKVELDIQKITCPGVWLCSNGKVTLQIHMFGSCLQTSSYKPAFPINCYEKLIFYKTFYHDHRLNDLQRSLNHEWFYAEFIQIQNCDDGCVLAQFRTTLDDLLYPTSFRGSIIGVEIDLLMEPTKLFPGTLAPKLEVSTKTTIEETLCDLNPGSYLGVIPPKHILSADTPQQQKTRPKRVCHSVGFSRAQKKLPLNKQKVRPIFQYRKVDDNLILRTNPSHVGNDEIGPVAVKSFCDCYCKLRSKSMESIPKRTKVLYRRMSPENIRRNVSTKCNCDECPVCSKYEGYFSSDSRRMRNCLDHCSNDYRLVEHCPHGKRDAKFHVRSRNGSPCTSDMSYNSDKKVCFCFPSDRTSELTQRLHEKLVRTLDSNRRFFDKCISCQSAA